jgi:hypothetical protein
MIKAEANSRVVEAVRETANGLHRLRFIGTGTSPSRHISVWSATGTSRVRQAWRQLGSKEKRALRPAVASPLEPPFWQLWEGATF